MDELDDKRDFIRLVGKFPREAEINTSENPNSTLNIISSYFPKIDIVKSNNFTNMNIFNNINVQYEYIEDGKFEK